MESQSQVTNHAIVIETDNNNSDVKVLQGDMMISGFKNNISANVYRTFYEMFENTEIVSWRVDAKEVTAFFKRDSESVIARFKKNGYLISIRKVYGIARLDSLVKDFIYREVDKDFSINLVTESTNENHTVYEISLFEKNRFYIIQVDKKQDGTLSLISKTLLTRG